MTLTAHAQLDTPARGSAGGPGGYSDKINSDLAKLDAGLPFLLESYKLPGDIDDTAAFLAATAAALAAGPGNTVLLAARAHTINASGSGNFFIATDDLHIQGMAGTVLTFGPEHASFTFTAFDRVAGKSLTFDKVTVNGPVDANTHAHIGIALEPSTTGVQGRCELTGVEMNNWAFCVSARGDTNLANSDNLVSVGAGCILTSNGLGQTVIHNGGSFFLHDDAVLDMVGGTNQNHLAYIAYSVSYDVRGTFKNAGGYGLHNFGGNNYIKPKFCHVKGAKFTGNFGTSAVLTNAIAPTNISGSTFANLTGDGVRFQSDVTIDACSFTGPSAIIQQQSGTNPCRATITNCPKVQNVTLATGIVGSIAIIARSRIFPDNNIDPIVLGDASTIIVTSDCIVSGGTIQGEMMRCYGGGALIVRGSTLSNAARPTLLVGVGGNYGPSDVGASITVPGAGVAGGDLVTTVQSVQGPNKLITAAACSSNVAGVAVTIGGASRGTGTMDTRSIVGAYVTGANSSFETDDAVVYDDETKAWNCDNNAVGSARMRRRVTNAAIASASTLVLGPNADTRHVSGTTTIDYVMLVANDATRQRLHSARVHLIADAAWATSAAGNIVPKSTGARAVGAMVTLQYDPTSAKWYEVA